VITKHTTINRKALERQQKSIEKQKKKIEAKKKPKQRTL